MRRSLFLVILLVCASGMYFQSAPAMATTTSGRVTIEATSASANSPPVTVLVEVQVHMLCTTSGTATEKFAIEVGSIGDPSDLLVGGYAAITNSPPNDLTIIWYAASTNSPPNDEITWKTACTTGDSPPTMINWTNCRVQDQQATAYPNPTALFTRALVWSTDTLLSAVTLANTGSTNTWLSPNYATTIEPMSLCAAAMATRVWCPNIGFQSDAASSVAISCAANATSCPRMEVQSKTGIRSSGAGDTGTFSIA